MADRSKRNKIIFIIVAMAAVVAAVYLIVNAGIRKNIVISDFISIEYNGIEGKGRTLTAVNSDAIYQELSKDEKNTLTLEKYRELADSVKVNLSKTEGLLNGESLSVSVEYDRELAKKLKYNFSEIRYHTKVSGLMQGKSVDLFENVEVTVAGTSPEVFANVVNKWDDEYLKNLSFSLDKSSNISQGETITVRCNAENEELEAHGISALSLTKEYKVDNVNSFVNNVSQLNMELLRHIKQEAVRTITEETESLKFRMFYKATSDSTYLFQQNMETVNATELAGAVFLSKKNTTQATTRNYIYLFFKSNITNGATTEDIYFAFEYTDAVIKADGTFQMDYNDQKTRYVCGMDFNDIYSRLVLSREVQYFISEFNL